MLFKDYHIWPLMLGLKTQTRRVWKKVHAKVGRQYDITHKMFYSPEDVVGRIYVTDVSQSNLMRMTEQDAMAEGGYDLKSYCEVITEINDNRRDSYTPFIKTTPLYVIKFRFALSDMIDPNGGTHMIDEYYWRWHDHMARFNIDVNSLIDPSQKGMIPDGHDIPDPYKAMVQKSPYKL